MKHLFLLGVVVLIIGCLLLSIGIVSYVRHVQAVEHIKAVCDKPGSSCPFVVTNNYDIYAEIGIVLIPIGIILLFHERMKRK